MIPFKKSDDSRLYAALRAKPAKVEKLNDKAAKGLKAGLIGRIWRKRFEGKKTDPLPPGENQTAASKEIGGTMISLKTGDLFCEKADVLVNTANKCLERGSGINGDFERYAGPSIYRECDQIKKRLGLFALSPGEAVMTHGGELKNVQIIHVVGPDCRIKREKNKGEELLREAYRNALTLARDAEKRSIALPSISTGVFGFDAKEAAGIAWKEIGAFVENNKGAFQSISLIVPEDQRETFQDAFEKKFLQEKEKKTEETNVKGRPRSRKPVKQIELSREEVGVGDKKTEMILLQGDLFAIEGYGVQALVNAANPDLEQGGGINGRFLKHAGEEIYKNYRNLAGQAVTSTDVGKAVIGPPGELGQNKSSPGEPGEEKSGITNIIHVPGPDCRVITDLEKQFELLKSAYKSSLEIAHKNGLRSIAFPSISTGIYGFPRERAAEIAKEAVLEYTGKNPGSFDRILFVVLKDSEEKLAFQKVFPK